jgi:hypothetical protein
MNTIRSLYFFGFLLVFLISIVGVVTHYSLKSRRRNLYPYGKWDELLERIIPIDHRSLGRVAGDPDAESDLEEESVEAMDPDEIWQILGGMRGINVMEKNCTVLVDLVFYVQQWYPEALLIAEQLRLNAREMEWHIGRIRAAAKSGHAPAAAAEYLRQAVTLYYQMTCEVLALYEQANLPGLADLRRTI